MFVALNAKHYDEGQSIAAGLALRSSKSVYRKQTNKKGLRKSTHGPWPQISDPALFEHISANIRYLIGETVERLGLQTKCGSQITIQQF